MSKSWPTVPLGQVIKYRKEFIPIDDDTEYKRCRVQLHVKGIILRDIVKGAEIKTKEQQVCRTNEFLVAEIDAKVGGFGIIPLELDGAIVSSHYFLYVVDETTLDHRYLGYYTRTPAFRDQVSAKGTTNYAAIRPHHVLNYKIPLPPLNEQGRLVARIEALAAKVEQAKVLRQQSVAEVEVVEIAIFKRVREILLKGTAEIKKIGQITTVTSGGTPSRGNPTYWDGDIPWIKTGELLDGDIYNAEEHITDEGLQNSSAKLFPPDTILIALYGQGQTRGRTGRLRIEATTNQACCAILPIQNLEPRFIQYWLRSLYSEMRENSHGGAQPNWNGQMIKDIEIAIPSLSEQRRIVAYLDNLQAKVDAVKYHQAATAARLEALLPSILDRAFRGEL